MSNNKEISKGRHPVNKFWLYVKKNSFSILMIVFIGIMFVSPDAKSWVLRQLMVTGIFNANIPEKRTIINGVSDVDFNFADETGNIQSTSALRGKVVFINFWASWCPPCRAEFPSIERLYSRFKNNPNVFFLTINEDDDLVKAKAYLNKEKYTIPLYTSRGHVVPKEVYSGALPTTVVLDKNGNIRLHHTGLANYASNKFIKQIEELISE